MTGDEAGSLDGEEEPEEELLLPSVIEAVDPSIDPSAPLSSQVSVKGKLTFPAGVGLLDTGASACAGSEPAVRALLLEAFATDPDM